MPYKDVEKRRQCWRESKRRKWESMTQEERHAHLERDYQRKANCSDLQRALRRFYKRQYYHWKKRAMTPEQIEAYNRKRREYGRSKYRSMTDEQRVASNIERKRKRLEKVLSCRK